MAENRIMIYMFNDELGSVVRHRDLLANDEIVSLVVPEGWGIAGKDAACVDGGESIGFNISSDFDSMIDCCDTVIINDYAVNESMQSDIKAKTIEAHKLQKNVINLSDIQQVKKRLNDTSIYGNNLCMEDIFFDKWDIAQTAKEEILSIETPVVFVIGVTENTNKFEIQLTLREQLLKKGYKVTQIGSKPYCELMGFYSFPKFMYEKEYSEIDKILMFNRYVKCVEEHESPDIIIIGIPGGMAKVSDEYTNKFGIFAYEVSQAVTPDYVIVSTAYDKYNSEYFKSIDMMAEYKLGFKIDCYNMALTKIDWEEILKKNRDIYIKLDYEFINEKKQEYGDLKIYNVYDKKDSIDLVDDIIEKLHKYSEVERI